MVALAEEELTRSRSNSDEPERLALDRLITATSAGSSAPSPVSLVRNLSVSSKRCGKSVLGCAPDSVPKSCPLTRAQSLPFADCEAIDEAVESGKLDKLHFDHCEKVEHSHDEVRTYLKKYRSQHLGAFEEFVRDQPDYAFYSVRTRVDVPAFNRIPSYSNEPADDESDDELVGERSFILYASRIPTSPL